MMLRTQMNRAAGKDGSWHLQIAGILHHEEGVDVIPSNKLLSGLDVSLIIKNKKIKRGENYEI